MAIDPSIALQTQPFRNQYNPLAASAGAAQTVNALVGAQAAQRQLAAQQAIGQAVQQATDPNTGYVDQNKVRALVSANPDAAFDAQQAVGTSQVQQGQLLTNQNSAVANQHQKIGFLAGLAAPLAADPTTTKTKVQDTIQHAVNFGLIDQGTAQQVLSSLPDDAAGVRQNLGNFLKSTMAPSDEYAHVYGSPAQLNNGPTMQVGTLAPADQGGGFRPNSITPLGVSPDTAAQQQAGTAPDGTPIATNTGARLQGEGSGNLLNPGPTRSVVPGAEKYPWNQEGGYSAAPAQGGGGAASSNGQPAPSSGQQPAGDGTVVTGPRPGMVQSMQAAADNSANAYSAANTQAASFSQRQYQAKTALGALQQLGPTGTGPGTEGRNALVSYATSLGFTAPSDQTKAYDEANKYLTAFAAGMPGASGSDSRLATALSANASTHISNLAAQDVVRATIALDRQNQGALLAFNQLPPAQRTPDQWQTFATNWSSKVDPRAYAFDLMTPAQRTKVVGGMSPAQKASFYGDVQNAVGLGLVQPPQQTAAAPATAPVVPSGN